MEEDNLTLKEKVEKLTELVEGNKLNEIKNKKIKIPRKAKVRKRKLKKGWVGIIRIDENGSGSGEKQKVSNFTFRTKDGSYHATDGREVIFWEGKYPVLFQQTWKTNPINFRKSEKEKNETYGQVYIRARMLADTIKVKAKNVGIILWVLLIGAALFGINYLIKGGV